GKPNVGKSSLVNALLGQERNIVTPIAGTTRDTVNTRFNAFGFNAWLLDTAGIRKKGKVAEDIEFYSVLRSVRSIEESDVCLLLIDAQDGMDHQSLSIFGLIERNGKGVVIVVNKWDLLEKDTNAAKKYEEEIRRRTAPFTDLPIVFTSVTEKQRIHRAMELAIKVYEARKQRIPTRKLNDVLLPEIERLPPPMYKAKSVSIKYVTQLPGAVPAFAFFTNLPQYIKDSYARFLENKLREHFNFHGVPIRVFFRKK
ncbi:MAG TPA: GTP-binding protein, partial [Flavobacteriales bacterium]|nr:GTP-binding protein [Flavobacteriales bacterium]